METFLSIIGNIIGQAEVNEILLLLLGASFVTGFLNDTLAAATSRLPGFAGTIAPVVVRWLSPRMLDWLRTRVKEAADRAVQETEAETVNTLATSQQKLDKAVKKLQKDEPGISSRRAREEIEKAVFRFKSVSSMTEQEQRNLLSSELERMRSGR